MPHTASAPRAEPTIRCAAARKCEWRRRHQLLAHGMKLATWNVNSLKVRLPHVLDWLAAQQPDVLCLDRKSVV